MQSKKIKIPETAKTDMKLLIDTIDDIISTCDVCIKYKKTRPWSAVGLLMAGDFNKTVVMDLMNIVNKIWFIDLIDLFILFSVTKKITAKEKNVITYAIFKIWLPHFEQLRKLLVDNGGEFVNEVHKELCEHFNVEFVTTPVESPWLNGTCEQHNGIIKEISKIAGDTTCFQQRALHWALGSKNLLSSNYGYLPNQLIYGKNFNFLSLLTNKHLSLC